MNIQKKYSKIASLINSATSWNSNLQHMTISNDQIIKYANLLVIYKIINSIDDKLYIGKCTKGLRRIVEHFRDYKNPKKQYRGKLLYRAMNKHGVDNFKWEILCVCDSLCDLDQKEKEYIQLYQSNNAVFGYNLTKGGDGGNTWSKLTQKEKENASIKLSCSMKRVWTNDPDRRVLVAQTLSDIRKDPIKSFKNSQTSSLRMTKLNKIGNNRKIRVICINTSKEYDSIKNAAIDIDANYGTLVWAIENNKKCKGFIFKKIVNIK